MKNYPLILVQIMIGATFWTWAKFKEIEIIDEEKLEIDNDKKYLIVANHSSKLDPFLITSFFPGKTKFKLLPYRYLVTEDYMARFLTGKLIRLFGGFSVSKNRNKGKKPLEVAQDFINKNQTVFIFPEGKINKKGKVDNKIKLGIGAIYLEKNNKDLYLIPARISKKKEKIIIKYKKPFRHNSFPKNLEPLIKGTMREVYSK